MDALPAAVGRYEVKAFIARGGMGTLYLAHDPVLQRQVAIKLLREADNEDLRARFTREVRSAANLRHRNIVTIFDVGDQNGQPFMAMEYIHGQTLASIIASDPPPSTIRRLQFIEDLCDGLAYAHKRGVVHRDIKPANLMVDAEGTLKILDFGIARAAAESGMTQAGLMIGTLNYMSPEQVAGSALDGRSDMFAVGAVLYELLARRQAFPGAIDGGVLNRILSGEPESLETLCPHLAPAIAHIVHRALRKDPADRFPDLLQMRSAVLAARRQLEAAMPLDAVEAETIHTPIRPDTSGATMRPARRGPDREELIRRRAQQIEDHVTAAREALAAGRYDEAMERCEQALLIDTNQSQALEIGERARLARDEAVVRDYLREAHTLLRNGELTSASQQVREALALIPEFPDAVELGRIIGEARIGREREQQRKQRFDDLLARGAAALDHGEVAAALVLADEALALFPADAAAVQFKEQTQQAIAARQRQERDQAARETAAEARRLFDEGQHADALAVLEEFWPAHSIVSQLWTELSAEATRLALAAAAAAAPAAAPDASPADVAATLFVPREQKSTAAAAVAPPPQGPPAPPASTPAATPPHTPATAPTPPPAAPVPATAAAVTAPRPASAATATGRLQVKPAAHSPASSSTRSPMTIYGAVAAVVLLLAGIAYIATRPSSPPEGTVATVNNPPAPAPAPAAPPVSSESAAAPPAVTSTDAPTPPPTVAPAPAGSSAAEPQAVEPFRQSVRRLLRRADYRSALTPAVSGLAIAPKDTELLQAITQIESQARTAALAARMAAGTPRPAPASYAQAGSLLTDAQQLSRTGKHDAAARAYWQAEALFESARAEVAAAAAAPALPRPATAAENTPPPAVVIPPAAPRPSPPESAAAPTAGGRSDAPRETAPAPRPLAGDDDAQIRAALAAYAQGYRSLDVNSILRVYPKAPADKLKSAFDEAREYNVQIDVSQVRVTGDRATVTSRVRQLFRPKVGRAQETTTATQFDLQRSGGGWVIVDRR